MEIKVGREVLAGMLRQHGEDDLAERALSVSDDELARIGTFGAYYAWSEDAIALGGSMGGARALSLASIDVLEDTGRDLRLSRPEGQPPGGSLDRLVASDRVMDRELRRHAAERQVPADRSKLTLDVLDPPAWNPAPPDAPREIGRRHELRTKPLIDLTDDDLGFMIGQQVALNHLVHPALRRLGSDIDENDYPASLLASLLCVTAAYWERSPDNDLVLHNLAEGARERFKPDSELRKLIDNFSRDHSARRVVLRARLASDTRDDWWSWPIPQDQQRADRRSTFALRAQLRDDRRATQP